MKKYSLMKHLFALAIVTLFAIQTSSASPRHGDRFYESFDWENAIVVYEKYMKKHSDDTEVIAKIATSYRMLNDWNGAEIWYGRLYESGVKDAETLYFYGQALRASTKYSQAQNIFREYKSVSGSQTAATIDIGGEEMKDILYANNFTVAITDINSKQADFSPVVYDGNVYFVSDRTGDPKSIRVIDNWNSRNFLQIYMVESKEDEDISGNDVKALPMRKVNNRYHEGPLAFHPVTNEMFFTRTNYLTNKAVQSADDVAKLKVYKTPLDLTKGKKKTSIEEALPFNNDEYSVGHVAFNADGSVMYFTSDMPGGYGETDIWMATVSNGTYGTPVNLGPTINTEGSEMFPYVHNNLVYFASNGHAGLGGLDIYTTSNASGAWSAPSNLGAPLNSNGDDFALVFENDDKGYFTSNRTGGIGDDDIYSFKTNGQPIKILVYDYATREVMSDVEISRPMETAMMTDLNGELNFVTSKTNLEDIVAMKNGFQAMDFEYDVDGYDIRIPMERSGVVKFIVQVLDKKSGLPLENSLVKLNEFESYSDADGYTYWLIYPEMDYLISGEKTIDTDKKYLTIEKNFNTNGMPTPDTWNATIILDYFELNKEIEIEDIYYDLDKYFIRNDAAGELNKVVALMKEYPQMIVEMGSHTDCRASNVYNMTLSQNRAKAAMEYLVRNGISASRLSYKGYGETKLTNGCACECDKPISSIGLRAFRDCEDAQVANCSDEDHQANRRTTFKIVKF